MSYKCQAATFSNYRHSQCDNRAKYDALVKNAGWDRKEDEEPHTVHLCGVHRNQAAKGYSLNIVTGEVSKHWSGGAETKPVVGVVSLDVERKRRIDTASAMATGAYRYIETTAKAIGREIVNYPDILDALAASDHLEVAEAVQRYHDAMKDYEQKRDEAERLRSDPV